MRSELGGTQAAPQTHARRDDPPQRTEIVCRQVISTDERTDHFAIRHRVFVEEQSVFSGSDLDSHDQDESVVRLLGYCDGEAVGTVRLFVLDRVAGIWQGDRLAVLASYRVRGIGAPLVRCAVASAAARGGRRMDAHIQLANVPFFHRLGWASVGDPEIYAGLDHQPMTIVLPPREVGIATVRSLSAGISEPDL